MASVIATSGRNGGYAGAWEQAQNTPLSEPKGHITIGPIPEMMDEANIGAPSRADLS